MGTTATSAITASLCMSKQYNSALYSNFSTVIGAFSKQIAKTMSGLAEVDAATAGILREIIYPALSGEVENVEPFAVARAIAQPVAFESHVDGKAEADEKAITALRSAQAIEIHAAKVFAAAAQQPGGQVISETLSLEALAAVSIGRANAHGRTIGAILDGSYWSRSGEWTCMQCGHVTKAPEAAECPCCKAGREFASA